MNVLTTPTILRDGASESVLDGGSEATFSDLAAFQQIATDFTNLANEAAQTNVQANLERLQGLRSQFVERLLAVKPPLAAALAPSVNAVAAACLKCRLRSFPRTPKEEELFSQCLSALVSTAPGESAMQSFAAVMMASHALELPSLPPLTEIPPDMRASWLSFLLEMPPAFARNGDGDKFAHYLQRVCDQLLAHLRSTVGPEEEVTAAFLSSTAFVQSYFNELNLRKLMTTRAAIIEDILTRRGATLDQLRIMRPCKNRPRIGFIVVSANDGTETTGLTAYLERLDRRRFDARLYSLFDPSGKMGALCRAAVETYVKLPGNISAAVSQLRGEDLDIAFFCTNLTAVAHPVTQIAAHRVAPIQATTLTSAATTGLRNMDVMISGAPTEEEGSPDHYSERLILTDGVVNCAPFQYMIEGLAQPDPVSRSAHGIPEDAVLFFSGANFYKILPELSDQWFRILSQVPNSYLMLMPFNPNWASNYPVVAFNARLRAQAAGAGVSLDRLRLHPPVPTIAHLHRIMEMADIYLDSFPFCGACSLYDALTVGLPIVACDGIVFRSRQSKAILEQEGLGDWISPNQASYAQRAIELAGDPALRDRERGRLNQIRRAGLKLADTAPYAVMMMRMYDRLVADWDTRVAAMRALDPGALAQRISVQALEIANRGKVFTDRDLVLQVVLPYLRSGGTRRLIDVGACVGGMTKPFLEEGWQAVMFEPDGRCHQQLAMLLDAYGGQACLEKAAVTADRDGTSQLHVARVPGLSGLSRSPFAPGVETVAVRSVALSRYIAAKGLFDVDFIKINAEGHDFAILKGIDFKAITPRLVMASFGDEFADQDRASIDCLLQDMRSRGYRACVVCSGALGEFEHYEWPKRLLAIGIDAVPPLPADVPLFGNLLFFRDKDSEFLPSLCDWLEQPRDWEQRGLTPN